MSIEDRYDRNTAFSRTLGWVSEADARRLRQTHVAIAGMGGVGGAHLMTLTRLGVGRFSVADFDRFEASNFNRQVGAQMSNLGRPKALVLEELALDVAPDLEFRRFDEAIDEKNVDAFLEGVDVFVDGIDLFAMDARRLVFARCRDLGIPAITSCPLGMGAATMLFSPQSMSFEDYFQLEGYAPEEQIVRFLMGLSPSALQRRALVTDEALDIAAGQAPSTPMGIQFASGVVATEVLKLVTERGSLRYAPHTTHFDAYSGRIVRHARRLGNRSLIQRLILFFASKQLLRR